MAMMLKTTLLLAALAALIVAIAGAIGGPSGMAIAFVLAVLINMGAYWFSGDIALRMAGAREVSPAEAPELHHLVEELATFARQPKPLVAIIDDPSPNAFATGRDGSHAAVGVTSGVLDILSRDELAGVLAHELAHVQNRDILISSVAATIAGPITLLANLAQWSLSLGGARRSRDEADAGGFRHAISSLLLILLTPLASTVIRLAISRSREYGADKTGANIHGNAESLASALEMLELGSSMRPLRVTPAASHLFIVNPLNGTGFEHLFRTHPPITERVRRLRRKRRRPLAA